MLGFIQRFGKVFDRPREPVREAYARRSVEGALRPLWIDGDHSYRGAGSDFDNFARYPRPARMVTKFESWSHRRYNNPKYKDKEKFAGVIRNKKDIIFRIKRKYGLFENNEATDPNSPRHWQLIYEEPVP